MRYLICNVTRWMVLVVGLLLFCFEQCAFAQADARIVHFPKDRSIGILLVLDSNSFDTSSYSDWEHLCEATGDVTVPAGKALRLDLGEQIDGDLSLLSALEPNDLSMLCCNRVEFADEELKHISHLTGLKDINLYGTGILGTGLKHLSGLKSLERLHLTSTHVGDKELAYLLDLPNLKSLSLEGTPVTDAGMVHVGKMTNLERLSLNSAVGDEGLSHLNNLTGLRSLILKNPAVTDEGLSHLAGLTNLEFLHLFEAQISNDGLAYLKNMKELKKLYVFSRQITNEGLVHLKDLEKLEYVSLSVTFTETGLEYLSNQRLRGHIRIDANTITPRGLELLSEMKSLEDVLIDCDRNRGEKTDDVVKVLSKSLTLKSLDICGGLTDDGIIYLKDMRSLQEISISQSQITSRGITVLAELPSLQKLSFLMMSFDSEKEWAALGKLSKLESLEMEMMQSRVTDSDIGRLTGLQYLKYLSVGSEIPLGKDDNICLDLTEKGFMYISKLKALEHLHLMGAKVTNKGLGHLAELPALKYLIFERCVVSENDLEQLEKKLPRLRCSIW